MKRRNGYRPPPRPDTYLSPDEQARLVREAGRMLHDAWFLLVAAGRITDAAEVQAMWRRLDSAPGVVSPPAPGVVHHYRNGQPYDADDLPLPTLPDPGQ